MVTSDEYSPELSRFFTAVTADTDLQGELYTTTEISDVATIARERGFRISGAEVLRAQAGRVLSLPDLEVAVLAAGRKSSIGAQWGRGGTGYLDRAGAWLLKVSTWVTVDPGEDERVASMLTELRAGESSEFSELGAFDEVARFMASGGRDIPAVDLVRFQAARLLRLDDDQAEQVASGDLRR